MNYFLICPVRNVDYKTQNRIRDVVEKLESQGHSVYWPSRDTDQTDPVGVDICESNRLAILESDVVAIYYDSKSQGSTFDIGIAFADRKPLMIINKIEPTEGKSFANVLLNWPYGRVEIE